MPGFVPFEQDRKRQAHYEKFAGIEQEVRQAIRNGAKVMDSDAAANDTMGL